LSFFLILTSSATQTTLYSGKMQKIQDFTDLDLGTFVGRRSVWYFFQPNCASCKKQSQNLSCLPKETLILAVGVLGSFERLKKEFKKHSPRAMPLWGGEDWQKKLKIEQTPTLLILDSTGTPVFRQESFVTCKELLKQWQKATPSTGT
jgi:thiol-disulfide isomerase/thioredoxin